MCFTPITRTRNNVKSLTSLYESAGDCEQFFQGSIYQELDHKN